MNRIQNIRKSRGYDITDKISLTFEPNPDTDEAIKRFGEYIARQVLATSLEIASVEGAEGVEPLALDDVAVNVAINLNK